MNWTEGTELTKDFFTTPLISTSSFQRDRREIALVQQKATADKSANLKRGLENAVKAIEAGNRFWVPELF